MTLHVDNDTAVTASVRGNQRTPYAVTFDWSRADEGEVSAACDCPRYDDGYLCKHIWAVLLEIDAAGLATSSAGPRRLEVVDGSDLDWTDDDEHAFLYRDPNAPKGEPWRDQLNRAVAYGSMEPSPRSTVATSARPMRYREAWYVVNVEASVRKRHLTIDLYQIEANKDGKLGRLKKLNLERDEIENFTNAEDRELLNLLTTSAEEPAHHVRYRTYSSCVIPVAWQGILLPKMSATRRLIWHRETRAKIDPSCRLVLDETPPWRFAVSVDADTRAQHWKLQGEIRRDPVRTPLADVDLILGDGLAMFHGRLIRLHVERGVRWIEALTRNPTVIIPYADRNAFLDWLWRSPSVPPIEWPQDLAADEVREPPRGHLAVVMENGDGNGRFLAGHVFFFYGEHRTTLHETRRGWFDAAENRVIARDAGAEQALVGELAELGITGAPPHSQVMGDVRVPRKRFAEIVRTLTARGWSVEGNGTPFRSAGEFEMEVSGGIDWFDLHGTLHFGDQSVSLPSLLKALRRGETFVTLDDGSQGVLPEDWLERYGKIARLGQVEGDALRFGSAQALLIDGLLGEQKSVDMDASFRRLREKLQASERITPASEPKGFRGTLRDYQLEGLGWLDFLRELGIGGCLADDMGLGKTVQVLALMQSRRLTRRERTTSIVLAPKSVIFNWIEEAERFAPELEVLDYTGTDRKARLGDAGRYDLLLTTYGTLRRDIPTLKDIHFDYAILDESQAIKNHNSQVAKASRLICADHRLALTGTPVENHIGELWSLFEFLNPGMLGGSTAFKDLAKGETDRATIKLLARALRPFILRRTKAQVLTELPEKTEQTLHCELSPSEREHYDELRDHYRSQLLGTVHELGFNKTRMHVLEALLRLRQAACHPGLLDSERTDDLSAKLQTLEKQLEEIVAEGHKVLVFSQFTSLLAIVRKRLEKQGIVYEYLDGRTRNRGERVKRFQEDADCPVFLISLKAGGHGLNLTAADYVVILDPWWNPAVEAQAVDRAHRIGQTRPVFAYRLIASDTIEEKILELQRSKQALADAIISADNSLLRTLTVEDLELLLS